ncbi:hypothetical protein AAF712_005661 [Marasmius tenuissimus]|uniref:Uncharacterized protein n=1 Tax=Marasmius tenuissimus TaxID=585030 RepID=A0ABR3A176_9AGAR|nr:hypothetical protein PM082_009527 [Marasmius tenuissimus]
MSQDSQVYARALYSRGHGCALWDPEPNDDLPPEYISTGTRIGDIGLIGSDGQFDFLFNACLPVDDPINQYNGTPTGFEPLIWDGRCAKRNIFFRPQQPIASKDSTQLDLSVETNASALGFPAGVGGGIGIQFSRENGAVVMPGLNGADRINALNKALFRNYAYKHGESWYQFANQTLGREAENGELYLITGFDKTNSYENAVVHRRSTTKSCSLAFTTGGLGAETRLRLSKTMGHEAMFTSRCSFNETHHNQSIFVRGFRISIRQGVLALLGSKIKVASTYNSSLSDVLDRKPGGAPFTQFSTSVNWSSGGRSLGGPSDTDMESDSPMSSDESSTSIEEDDFIPESKIYHPLVSINEHILLTKKDVNIVVIHDDDWISLLDHELDDIMPSNSTLLTRLRKNMSVIVDNGHATVIQNMQSDDTAPVALHPPLEESLEAISSSAIMPSSEWSNFNKEPNSNVPIFPLSVKDLPPGGSLTSYDVRSLQYKIHHLEGTQRHNKERIRHLEAQLASSSTLTPSESSSDALSSASFGTSWRVQTAAQKRQFGTPNRAGDALCAYHNIRRERRAFPPRNAPAGYLNCGCSDEEALFEESLARNGVGSCLPDDSIRMDPALRNPLLRLLQRQYGYRDGDFERDPSTGGWISGEGPEKWEHQSESRSLIRRPRRNQNITVSEFQEREPCQDRAGPWTAIHREPSTLDGNPT